MIKQFYLFEAILAAHVLFCLFIEFQSVLFPRELTLEELENLKPNAKPHANHNKYFDLYSFFGFLFWLAMKYLNEGFRMNSLLILLAYTLFFFDRAIQFTDKIFCQVSGLLTLLYIWTLVSFPMYKLPRPTGLHRICHKTIRLNDNYGTQVSVYYPCADNKQQDIQIKWLPKKDYAKNIYRLVISRTNLPLPEWFFDVALNFLDFLKFNVSQEQPLLENTHDVIVFSHGLSQHKNSYSYIASQWASQGYIVFCPQHLEMVYPWDQKQTKLFRTNNYPEVVEKFQKIRSEHLNWRVEQLQYLIDVLQNGKIKEFFYDFKPQNINLIGHSFGGATVLRLGQQYELNSVIGYDPWILPFKNEDLRVKCKSRALILIQERKIIKDDMHDEKYMKELLQNNQQIQSYRVKGYDHPYPTDLTYFIGGEMQLMGELRNFEDAHKLNQFFSNIAVQFMKHQEFTQEQQKLLFQ